MSEVFVEGATVSVRVAAGVLALVLLLMRGRGELDEQPRSPVRYCVIFAWARVWLSWSDECSAARRPDEMSSSIDCAGGAAAASTALGVPLARSFFGEVGGVSKSTEH